MSVEVLRDYVSGRDPSRRKDSPKGSPKQQKEKDLSGNLFKTLKNTLVSLRYLVGSTRFTILLHSSRSTSDVSSESVRRTEDVTHPSIGPRPPRTTWHRRTGQTPPVGREGPRITRVDFSF